jgi:Domain of unknown function (DUF4249)
MRIFLKIHIKIIFLVFLYSCTKVIEIDLPMTDSKVVVNSLFTDSKQIKVHLSKSINVLDNTIPVINDATIILLKDNAVTDTLFYNEGYYFSHISAEIGKEYSLIISVPGMDSVICRDIIPKKTILQSYNLTTSVMTDEDGFIINELQLDFQDFAGPNFYEVDLKAENLLNNNMVGLWFKKNSDPVITSTGLLDYNPGTLIFTDKMFDGKSCSVKVYYAITPGEGDYKLKITFRSISESYFKYKEKQFAYLFSLDSDIFSGMSEPIQLYSNIKGGYGIFAGYSSDEKVIIVSGK